MWIVLGLELSSHRRNVVDQAGDQQCNDHVNAAGHWRLRSPTRWSPTAEPRVPGWRPRRGWSKKFVGTPVGGRGKCRPTGPAAAGTRLTPEQTDVVSTAGPVGGPQGPRCQGALVVEQLTGSRARPGPARRQALGTSSNVASTVSSSMPFSVRTSPGRCPDEGDVEIRNALQHFVRPDGVQGGHLVEQGDTATFMVGPFEDRCALEVEAISIAVRRHPDHGGRRVRRIVSAVRSRNPQQGAAIGGHRLVARSRAGSRRPASGYSSTYRAGGSPISAAKTRAKWRSLIPTVAARTAARWSPLGSASMRLWALAIGGVLPCGAQIGYGVLALSARSPPRQDQMAGDELGDLGVCGPRSTMSATRARSIPASSRRLRTRGRRRAGTAGPGRPSPWGTHACSRPDRDQWVATCLAVQQAGRGPAEERTRCRRWPPAGRLRAAARAIHRTAGESAAVARAPSPPGRSTSVSIRSVGSG